MTDMTHLMSAARSCTLCAAKFQLTHTAHAPRPVVWLAAQAQVLIAGQAPGLRVQSSGRPFDDASGARLREWLALPSDFFWNPKQVAFLPMAFCFPGYDAKGADLMPPRLCAQTWRSAFLRNLTHIKVTFLIGAYAQRWHLEPEHAKGGITATVARWRDYGPDIFPLPHPSWRNSAWLKRNTWFEAELLPAARTRLAEVLGLG